MHFDFFQYFELLSLLLALVCYQGLKKFSLTAFVPLLIIINVMEIIGVNYSGPNYFIYNMLILLQTPFFLFLYGKMLMLRDNELTVFRIVSALALFFILFNYFFWQGTEKFTNYSFILIQVLNIVLSCLVLLRLYMLETNIILLVSPYFWINAANLLFGLAVLILLGLQDYIIRNNIKIGDYSLYRYILPFATIVLYSFYSFAFVLCRKRINRWSLSS
jgi:hypothetical protein